MPLLRRLVLNGYLTAPAAGDEEHEAIALLQRMPFTSLHVSYRASFGLGSLLHHLPQLRDLACTANGQPIAEAVSTAPQLTKLAVSDRTPHVQQLRLLHCWWRRMGCPSLQTDGRVDEAEWEEHLVDQAEQPLESVGPPLLRELIVQCREDTLPAEAFPYLAHLSNLRVLECTLLVKDLRALGLLPQLEELRLLPVFEYDSLFIDYRVEEWTDAALLALGDLPLLHLHTLRLGTEDEAERKCKSGQEPRGGDDPDFPWGRRDEDGQRWKRAALQIGVTLAGLRALLQLPALAALSLPWIDERVMEQFRQLAQQHNRAALRIDRSVPLSRRSLLERHWLSVKHLGADD